MPEPSVEYLVKLACASVAVLLALAACSKRAPPPAPELAVASASASAAAPVVEAPAPRRIAKIEPNLLDVVPAKIAVSSTVQNPRDFPEHLVDGKLDTAWNGKTGDLVGGWIAFRVPKDAKVSRIELVVGMDKVKGDVDLFGANHRISRVALFRDGKKLGEHALDPEKRSFQSIPVDGPGGDYQIKVLATQPGKNPSWKELVVSELRVVGEPGREKRSAKEPVRVTVGSLDKDPDDIEVDDVDAVGPSSGLASVCTKWLASLDATKREREETAKFHDLRLGGPSCQETPLKMRTPFVADASFQAVHALRLYDGIVAWTQLVVDLPSGAWLLPVRWGFDDPLDPGCPSIVRMYALRAVRIENGHFLAILDGDRTGYDDEGKPIPVAMTGATWCKASAGKPSCKQYDPQMQGSIGVFAIAPDGTLRPQ